MQPGLQGVQQGMNFNCPFSGGLPNFAAQPPFTGTGGNADSGMSGVPKPLVPGVPLGSPGLPPGVLAPGIAQPVPTPANSPAAQSPSPLLRIRAGIEAGSPTEVLAGVREADAAGVVLAPNVRDMITQWLAVNAPMHSASMAQSAPGAVGEAMAAGTAVPEPAVAKAVGPVADLHSAQNTAGATVSLAAKHETNGQPQEPSTPNPCAPDVIRKAMLRLFEGAPKGSDAAAGLGMVEGEDGARFLPLQLLGMVLGIVDDGEDVMVRLLREIREAPPGVFILSQDDRSAGLIEWAGWEEFSTALSAIVAATRDPAFEPRSIQQLVARVARGAVRAGHVRQADVLRFLQESLSPQEMPEDAAPALRSAISRRTRLALACVVDAVAAHGLGPEAGPDSMGLVGQLPRALFGLIFDNIDDRDRGACAFLGEVLQSWDRRRCFSKRWLQDAASKFTMPKGINTERDDGRGWYGLTAENLHKPPKEGKPGESNVLPQVTFNLSEEPDQEAATPQKTTHKSQSQQQKHVANSEANRTIPKSTDAPTTQELEVSVPQVSESKETSPQKESAQDATPECAERSSDRGEKGKRKRTIVQDEEDDETVARHLEESRKRRAALMAKYQGGGKE